MNAERFASLADAYGGDIRRWPAGEQDAAFAHLAARPRSQAVLLAAASLDAALNAVPPLMASDHLRQRLLFTAPRLRPMVGRFGAWASGLGLAAACAAGLMLGINNAGLLEAPAAPAIQVAAVSAPSAIQATPAISPAVTPRAAQPESGPAALASETVESASFDYGGSWFSGLESEG